jgi:hypothetical protein
MVTYGCNYETHMSIKCSQEPITGPILTQANPFHTLPHNFSHIRFNIIRPSMLGCSKYSMTLRFSDYNYECVSSMRATCPYNFIPLDLFTLIYLAKSTNYELPQYTL